MYIKNNTALLNSSLNFIENMLLLEKINIFDIPFELRTSFSSLYITACRVARSYGIEEYRKIIQLLKEDIKNVDKVCFYSLNKALNDLEGNMSFFEDKNE